MNRSKDARIVVIVECKHRSAGRVELRGGIQGGGRLISSLRWWGFGGEFRAVRIIGKRARADKGIERIFARDRLGDTIVWTDSPVGRVRWVGDLDESIKQEMATRKMIGAQIEALPF